MTSVGCLSNFLDKGLSFTRSHLAASTYAQCQRWMLIIPGLLLLFLGWLISDGFLASVPGASWQAVRLESQMNGWFLVCLGVIWPRLVLPAPWRRALVTTILCGTCLKWILTLATNVYVGSGWIEFSRMDTMSWFVQHTLFELSLISLGCALLMITGYLVLGVLKRAGFRPERTN